MTGDAPACAAALRDIRMALRRARALPPASVRAPEPTPPVLWLPRLSFISHPCRSYLNLTIICYESYCFRRHDTSRESVESVERKPASGDEGILFII